MRIIVVIARLVFWPGLILGTGTAWGQPATEKSEGVHAQLLAPGNLNPRESNAQALELFLAGRYREAEPLYRAALAGWERMGAVAERDRIVHGSEPRDAAAGRGPLRGGRICAARLYPPGRSPGTRRLGQEKRGMGLCGQELGCTLPGVAATR